MIHPIVACAADIRASLKGVASVNPTFMSTDDKATALGELVRAEAQLVELRLRVLADAGDLAVATAARDAAGWLAKETRTRFADARADLALATALDREHPVLAAAMREGDATLAQAQVIRRAIAALPSSVDADTVAQAEAHLVAQAAVFGPKELARLGRRILDVVAPEIAEEAEARRLAELEAHAADRTRFTMRRLGDGTTRISGRRAGRDRDPVRDLPRGRGQPPQARRRQRRRRGRGGSVHPAAVPEAARASICPVPGVPRPDPAPGPRW